MKRTVAVVAGLGAIGGGAVYLHRQGHIEIPKSESFPEPVRELLNPSNEEKQKEAAPPAEPAAPPAEPVAPPANEQPDSTGTTSWWPWK